jgi:predicted ATPase
MYIKSVHIKNIRSIQELAIDFSKNSPDLAGWHVLIGENGSGKTTILRCMAFGLMGGDAFGILRCNFDDYVNLRIPEAATREIELRLSRHSSFDNITNLPKSIEKYGSREGILEYYERNSDLGSWVDIGDYVQNKFVPFYFKPNTNPREFLLAPLIESQNEGYFSCAFGPFRRWSGGNDAWDEVYKSDPRTAAHMSLFGEDVALTQIEPWLNYLHQEEWEEKRESIVLRNIKTLLNDRGLLPNGTKLEKINRDGLFFKDSHGVNVSINQLSDGYRSVLSMTMELVRQLIRVYGEEKVFATIEKGGSSIDLPGVVLIDEVDAHLHPSWQVNIGDWFTTYFPKIQFIVTTHSPLICRAAERGSIWKLPALGTGQVEEVIGIDKDRLIFGNVLDAFGTELFGSEPVKFKKNDEKRSRLGKLKMRSALGVITEEERTEKLKLEMTLATDDSPAI